MFGAVVDAVYTYANSVLNTTLSGIKSVRKGAVDASSIPTDEMPCLTIAFAGGTVSNPTGNVISVTGAHVILELYVAELEQLGDAQTTALNLLWSDDGHSGLIPAFKDKGYSPQGDSSGAPLRLKQFTVAATPGTGKVYGIQLPLLFEMMHDIT